MPLYFEDLQEGAVLRGDECVAESEEMIAFARRNDPLPFRLDEEAAKKSLYGGLVASAGFVVTLWYRSGIPILANLVFVGASEWRIRLKRPVRPGDCVRTEVTILGKRLSNKPGRGWVTTQQRILDQDGETVFECDVEWLFSTRPAPRWPGQLLSRHE